jgi:hypothetical protein
MLPAASDAGAGFLTSQDDLGKTKRSLGLGAAYLGLVLTKTGQASGQDLDKVLLDKFRRLLDGKAPVRGLNL